MNKILSVILFLIFNSSLLTSALPAQELSRDTVITGIYVTSIHGVDFKEKEFIVNFWLWLKYKNKEFDFLQNLEVPQAKTVVQSFSTIDSSDNRIYILMKLQCVMKDSWRIENFPFDHQKLRISIENSQFDSHTMVFVADTVGKHYDPQFTLNGWSIDSFDISVGTKSYETTFGDVSIDKPHSEYSAFNVRIGIQRAAMGLFWKMFLGMYVAFLIAYACFYIHADSIDSRFNLSVGAVFAVVGNKYIIDAALPESVTFTLVDTLHCITLLFILVIIASNAYALKLIKKNKINEAIRFDKVAARVILLIYFFLNVYFIFQANAG